MLVRREFLKNSFAVLSACVLGGLMKPLRALAGGWPRVAFESHGIDETLRSLFGTALTTPSTSITITAPAKAENGALVRCAVAADLPDVTSVAVLVERNPIPLVTAMSFNGAKAYLALGMKMAQTSDVYAIARSQGKLYSARQNIQVVLSGCA